MQFTHAENKAMGLIDELGFDFNLCAIKSSSAIDELEMTFATLDDGEMKGPMKDIERASNSELGLDGEERSRQMVVDEVTEILEAKFRERKNVRGRHNSAEEIRLGSDLL